MPKIFGQSNAQRHTGPNLTDVWTRVSPTSRHRHVQSSWRITSPAPFQLSADQKLDVLRPLDRWRPWRALNDQRLCLGGGRLMTGHDIDAVPAKRDGEEPVELHCPTQGCQSIPLDWILPNPRARETQPETDLAGHS